MWQVVSVPYYFVARLEHKNRKLALKLKHYNEQMAQQCQLSNSLLLNILPAPIIPRFVEMLETASRLGAAHSGFPEGGGGGGGGCGGGVRRREREVLAYSYEKCSLLFAHITGLEKLNARYSILTTVTVLNELVGVVGGLNNHTE